MRAVGPPGEGHQLAHRGGGAGGAGPHVVDQARAFGKLFFQQIEAEDDGAEGVVEIMGDTAGERADAFEALGPLLDGERFLLGPEITERGPCLGVAVAVDVGDRGDFGLEFFTGPAEAGELADEGSGAFLHLHRRAQPRVRRIHQDIAVPADQRAVRKTKKAVGGLIGLQDRLFVQRRDDHRLVGVGEEGGEQLLGGFPRPFGFFLLRDVVGGAEEALGRIAAGDERVDPDDEFDVAPGLGLQHKLPGRGPATGQQFGVPDDLGGRGGRGAKIARRTPQHFRQRVAERALPGGIEEDETAEAVALKDQGVGGLDEIRVECFGFAQRQLCLAHRRDFVKRHERGAGQSEVGAAHANRVDLEPAGEAGARMGEAHDAIAHILSGGEGLVHPPAVQGDRLGIFIEGTPVRRRRQGAGQQFRAPQAGQLLRGGVGIGDPSGGIADEHPLGHGFEERAVFFFAVAQLVLQGAQRRDVGERGDVAGQLPVFIQRGQHRSQHPADRAVAMQHPIGFGGGGAGGVGGSPSQRQAFAIRRVDRLEPAHPQGFGFTHAGHAAPSRIHLHALHPWAGPQNADRGDERHGAHLVVGLRELIEGFIQPLGHLAQFGFAQIRDANRGLTGGNRSQIAHDLPGWSHDVPIGQPEGE